jgi:succinylglutamic semialdehyde dehydrogenase
MAAIISRATGKPLWDAATEAAAMVGKAELSVKAYEERTPSKEAAAGPFIARITHHPHGVMAVLGPFNFPGHLPNGHIMPALIAGNTVIFKPSEQTPEVAEFTLRLWEEAGIPPGVINLLQGARAPAEQLVAHDNVHGILFTGGVPAGRAIHRALGGKLEKIVALELGGNNPLVVWDAADLQSAAKLIVKSAYITSGQRCTCSRRLIIKAGKDGNAVLDALTTLIDRLTIDRPDAQPQPFIGPLISAHAAQQVLAVQAEWLRNGGIAIRESKRLPIGPAYLSPGLIDVTALPERRDEEIFGPLLQVIRVTDFEAALDEANNTRFGLAAGLISDSAELFTRFESEVRAGVLNWNRQTTGASGAAPFGGVGQSGNHRPAGYYAADYSAWPMASLIAPGAVKDDEAIVGLKS